MKNIFYYGKKITRITAAIVIGLCLNISPLEAKGNIESSILLSTHRSIVDQVSNKVRISGTVHDTSGMPIIGVSIINKSNPSSGTISDVDGNFALEIEKDAILTASYIGYKTQEVHTKNKSVLSIILHEDVELLDEVVVVGFGTQKRANLTGAVSTVSADAFENRPVQNAAMMLQGVVPGLNISKGSGDLNASPSINIRGLTTIGEGSSGNPLILIDGMEGDINLINPQDIENISVLKDAASASIYGSRAPFGVILVTTKKGREGKIVINYNDSFRWNTPSKRPKPVDSYRFATYFNEAAENAQSIGHFTPERMQRIKDYMDGTIHTKNIPDPSNPLNWGDGYNYANDNVDWYDAIYSNWSFAQEHTASISGGTEKLQIYSSLNFLDSKGLMKLSSDTYKRFATNLKLSATVSKHFAVDYGVRYSRYDYDRPSMMSNIQAMGYTTWPILPVYDDNGYLFSAPSPAAGIKEGGRNKTSLNQMDQQLSFTITPFQNWIIKADLNYSFISNRNHADYQKTYNHNVAGEVIPNSNSTSVYEYSNTSSYINPNIYSTYTHILDSGHGFKVMLGFQSEQFWGDAFSADRNGIMVPGMDVIDVTNGTDGNGKTVAPGVAGNRNKWAVAGFFGRLNYDWKNRYLVELNYRYDGTSRFRKDKRWKSFPSFSLGWNIAQEEFWEDFSHILGTLKPRVSYGVLGNQNTTSWYPTYQTMPIGTANGAWLVNGQKPNTAYAPNIISSSLTWETVSTLDFGIDISMFNNRLTAVFDWYSRKTKNMVGPAPEMPAILGTAVPKTNNTDLKTTGWEITLNWRDQLANGLSYNVGFNLADDKSTITSYPNDTYDLGKYYSGRRVGEIWGYETIGIAKTNEEMTNHLNTLPNGGQSTLGSQWEAGDIMYKDLNGDGSITSGSYTLHDHGDLKVIGNNAPRLRFGLNLGANWKGFDLSMFFQGVMKRDYWEGSYNFFGFSGDIWRSVAFKEHMDYFRADPDHVMGENINSYYPRPLQGTSKNHKAQTRYLQKGSYIRLKNLTFGYTLPNQWLRVIGVSKVRLFLSGENLWTGTKLSKIFDPESLGSGTGSIGYPIFKTLSFGINVNF